MSFFERVKKDGISLKTTHSLMILVTIIMTALLLAGIVRTGLLYRHFSDTANQYSELQNAAKDLMDASDYLTDKVQRFTVMQDPADMEDYFHEADNVRRRDKAIDKMSQIAGGSQAFASLSAAMDASRALMTTEFTAMKIVCHATGVKDLPGAVAEMPLPDGIAGMTAAEQLHYAQMLVHDERYYETKYGIRSNMGNCVQALMDDAALTQSGLSARLRQHLITIMALILLQSAAMILILWMTSYLGINPIIQGVRKIRDNQQIPVTGSYEFRYLAKTYNMMYEAFQQSIRHLNYDASHDKLTGLYNRAGYDVVKNSIDLKTTAVLLIDADKFKEINDTYGHATGDAVLQKIADCLKHTFRHEDYICRIGGDEFVVFMLRMEERREELIRLKTDLINRHLADTSDGVPKISLSVGVAFGGDSGDKDIDQLLQCADEALYQMKAAGRNGCAFYEGAALCPAE